MKGTCSANSSKEKTPMCLVNELARHNQITHQYRLTHEDGPAHKKIFTVTLNLGNEEYQADGSSIKKAQHCAASLALKSTSYKHPPPKFEKPESHHKHFSPTVELNALAMKRGEPTQYTFIEQPPNMQDIVDHRTYQYRFLTYSRGRSRGSFRGYPTSSRYHPAYIPPPQYYGGAMFKVSLKVKDREYFGEGDTPQRAKYNAACEALEEIKNLMSHEVKCNGDSDECSVCPSEKKSPVSRVHEIALKHTLPITFEVVGEKGQPHMRVYITKCTVGEMFTIGEGNGKKISKSRAAELMLEQLAQLPAPQPPENLRGKKKMQNRLNNNVMGSRRGNRQAKQQVSVAEQPGAKDQMCPMTQLREYQISIGEPEPQYIVQSSKPIANSKKKEITVVATVGEKSVLGVSLTKKGAMKNAAKLLLIELGVTTAKRKPLPNKKKKGSKKESTSASQSIVEDQTQPVPKNTQSETSNALEQNIVNRTSKNVSTPNTTQNNIQMVKKNINTPPQNMNTPNRNQNNISAQQMITPIVSANPEKIVSVSKRSQNNTPTSLNRTRNSVPTPNRNQTNVPIANSTPTNLSTPTRPLNALHTSNGQGPHAPIEGGRQLVPGMILISPNTPRTPVNNMHRDPNIERTFKIAQEYLTSGSSPTADAMSKRRKDNRKQVSSANYSCPKDQLIHLSQISGFQIQFNDFPNSQMGPEAQGFLSLVQLYTSPAQVCHGVGVTIEQSQNEAALNALRFIADMKILSLTPPNMPQLPHPLSPMPTHVVVNNRT